MDEIISRLEESSIVPKSSDSPPGCPVSPYFAVKQTPHSGRAVFATKDIEEDTVVYETDDLCITVLLREYRREVCAQCFSYDRGVEWKIRDNSVCCSFCSEECRIRWRSEADGMSLAAMTAVESLVKGRTKEDLELVDEDCPRPTAKDITKAWEKVAAAAASIREARRGSTQKSHLKSVKAALALPVSPDIVTFLVGGILLRYRRPEYWPTLLALAVDSTPYRSPEELLSTTRSYLHLLAVLPEPLLDITTPELCFLLYSRDSHNSFGIRSLEDDGSEFFGYGTWPAASYFNHSCDPNVLKKRVGRKWVFTTARDIEEGEELCITYLSGEERALSRGARMDRLKKSWGFECACDRCGM